MALILEERVAWQIRKTKHWQTLHVTSRNINICLTTNLVWLEVSLLNFSRNSDSKEQLLLKYVWNISLKWPQSNYAMVQKES